MENTGEIPLIGSIHCIYQDEKGVLWLQIQRYYRPSETPIGFKPFHGAQEVFSSHDFVYCHPKDLVKKCTVQSFDEYSAREDYPPNSFYTTTFFDWFTQKTIAGTGKKLSFRRESLVEALATSGKSPGRNTERELESGISHVGTVPLDSNLCTKNNLVNSKKVGKKVTKIGLEKNSNTSCDKARDDRNHPPVAEKTEIGSTRMHPLLVSQQLSLSLDCHNHFPEVDAREQTDFFHSSLSPIQLSCDQSDKKDPVLPLPVHRSSSKKTFKQKFDINIESEDENINKGMASLTEIFRPRIRKVSDRRSVEVNGHTKSPVNLKMSRDSVWCGESDKEGDSYREDDNQAKDVNLDEEPYENQDEEEQQYSQDSDGEKVLKNSDSEQDRTNTSSNFVFRDSQLWFSSEETKKENLDLWNNAFCGTLSKNEVSFYSMTDTDVEVRDLEVYRSF
eukprot:TRINITY_DN9165_c0_g1_i4.p1 TRINITY_DN9165_c0_g1~~TRINITY_DN9165_c0_g1_i4.p1  ORF type:complete len:515 (+),score=81.17 TRINITY_DN9165_c0_g1_i4:207-1547(+)